MYMGLSESAIKEAKKEMKRGRVKEYLLLPLDQQLIAATETKRFYLSYINKQNECPTFLQTMIYMYNAFNVLIDNYIIESLTEVNALEKFKNNGYVPVDVPDIQREIFSLDDIKDLKFEKIGDIIVDYTTDNYSDDFKIIREDVLNRDYHMCVNCGNLSELCVHHIANDKQNSDMENLITLCNSCHSMLPIHRFRGKEINLDLVKRLSIMSIFRTLQFKNKHS